MSSVPHLPRSPQISPDLRTSAVQVHFREQRIEQLAQEKERLQYERQRRPPSLPAQPSLGPSDSASRPVTEGGDEAPEGVTLHSVTLPSTGAAAGRDERRAARHRRRRRGGDGGAAAEGSERASEEAGEEGSEATSAASDRTDATPAGHIRCYAARARAKVRVRVRVRLGLGLYP